MTWFIGVWCLTAAIAVGWLLWGLHKAGQAELDRHIETALAMARDRHPATRAERIGRVVVPGRVCATCSAPVVGPMVEHICGGGPR